MDRLLTPARAAGAIALLAFAASIVPVIVGGVPTPQIADEFSYLLAADTFAHGRVTNPTHPLWPHFETFYVLQRPTYMSRYQPGQGLVLALGQSIGSPVIGLWLSAALLAAAVVWMLAAWMPMMWAVIGGVLVAVHPTTLSWNHSYWGGSVAAIGGALIVGAVRRLYDRDSLGSSLILGLGVVILAETRPFEGAVFVAGIAIAALSLRIPIRRLVPSAFVLAAGAALILYYNARVTGHPLRFPYVEYDSQYTFTPPLFFQTLHPVELRQHMMWKLTVEWAGYYYLQQHSFSGFLESIPDKVSGFVNGLFQVVPGLVSMRFPQPAVGMLIDLSNIVIEIVFVLPLVMIGAVARRDRCISALAIAFAVTAPLALFPTLVPQLHYAAPFLGAFVLLWLASLREIVDRRVLAPRLAAVIVGVVWIASTALTLDQMRRRPFIFDEVPRRLEIVDRLQRTPGRHLVVVDYAPDHFEHFEWVENGADIDGSRIVWAHSIPSSNAALFRYFRDRHIWLLLVAKHQRLLIPIRSP